MSANKKPDYKNPSYTAEEDRRELEDKDIEKRQGALNALGLNSGKVRRAVGYVLKNDEATVKEIIVCSNDLMATN